MGQASRQDLHDVLCDTSIAVSSEALQTHCSQVSGSMSGHQDMQRAETLTTRHSVKTENAISFSTLNPSMPLNVAASV